MAGVSKWSAETGIANPMGIPAHDYIENSYDASDNLTMVTYKLGGSSGTTVAVLEMTYDASQNLITVERTT